MKNLLSIEDLKEVETLTYDQKLTYLNARANEELSAEAMSQCLLHGHVGRLTKLAEMTGEFEAFGYGYRCISCGKIKTLEALKEWFEE